MPIPSICQHTKIKNILWQKARIHRKILSNENEYIFDNYVTEKCVIPKADVTNYFLNVSRRIRWTSGRQKCSDFCLKV